MRKFDAWKIANMWGEMHPEKSRAHVIKMAIEAEREFCANAIDEFTDQGYSAFDIRDYLRGKLDLEDRSVEEDKP